MVAQLQDWWRSVNRNRAVAIGRSQSVSRAWFVAHTPMAAGKQNDFSLKDFPYEKDIHKDGKIDQAIKTNQTLLVQIVKEPKKFNFFIIIQRVIAFMSKTFY